VKHCRGYARLVRALRIDRMAEDAGLKKKSGNTDSSLIRVDNIVNDVGEGVITGLAGYTMSQHIKNKHKKRF
jgi:hypothetical protein